MEVFLFYIAVFYIVFAVGAALADFIEYITRR